MKGSEGKGKERRLGDGQMVQQMRCALLSYIVHREVSKRPCPLMRIKPITTHRIISCSTAVFLNYSTLDLNISPFQICKCGKMVK